MARALDTELETDVRHIPAGFGEEDCEISNVPFICLSLPLKSKRKLPVASSPTETPTRAEIDEVRVDSTLRSTWCELHKPGVLQGHGVEAAGEVAATG